MKKYFLCGMLMCLGLIALAQHCRYDGSTMIMLDISKSPNQKINKIYLLDSAGAVVMSKHYTGDQFQLDSAQFWKNPPGEAKEPSKKWLHQHYPFAKDYDILALGAHDQPLPYRVEILYSSGNNILRKEVPLLNNHIHQLCTNNQELWSGKVKPMSVIL